MVPLGEVLTRVDRFDPRDELTEYQFAGTYSFGRGIFVGERKLGSAFRLPKVQRIHNGDFVYCKIMAWEGAFGIVPIEADQCVLSGAFVVYELDRTRVDPRYLDYWFKIETVWKTIGGQSTGTNVRRRSLHPRQFEAATVPLPPLPEQRRIAARIEELAAKIAEARGLRRQAEDEVEALLPSSAGRFFSDLAERLGAEPLGSLTTCVTDGPHLTPTYVPEGIPFVTVRNMVSGKMDFSQLNYITPADHTEFCKRCKPEYGDVLYSKDGATRGRPCFVDTHREFSIFVSVALIKPKRDRLDGRYLSHVLGSSWIRDRMAEKSRGDMIPHIVLRQIKAFPIPAPSLAEQCRIVEYFDNLQAKVDAVKRLQAETATELEAMLPSVLDRAFRGEL
jgi:type I restriction enzyme S subunit